MYIELNSFHYVQRLDWGEKLHLLDLLMKYEKRGLYWLKNSENWATQVQDMPFWTNTYLTRSYTLINQFKACQMCCQANPIYSMSSWAKLHLHGFDIVLLIHPEKNQSPIIHMWPSRPFLFQSQLPHCGLLYFIYFVTYWIYFIDSVLMLHWII